MAINDQGNGFNKFDPSKRVRDVLGDEYVNSVEAEALARLSQASKAAVRNNNTYNEDGGSMGNPKEVLGKIQHSTQTGQAVHQRYLDEQGLGQSDFEAKKRNGREAAKIEWVSFTNKSKVDKIGIGLTGLSKNNTKGENFNALVNNAARTFLGFIANDVVETLGRVGDVKKYAIGAAGSAILDGIVSYTSGANNKTLDKFFDENNITKAESDIIRSRINAEKLKYAVEHAAAGVVLPAVAKFGLDKVVKDKSNKIVGAALSFGTLSTIGKGVLQACRLINDKRLHDQTVLLPEVADSKLYYEKLATAVTHKLCDAQIDNTIIGGAIGSYVGYKSVSFEYGPAVDYIQQKPAIVIETKEKKPAAKKAVKKSA